MPDASDLPSLHFPIHPFSLNLVIVEWAFKGLSVGEQQQAMAFLFVISKLA